MSAFVMLGYTSHVVVIGTVLLCFATILIARTAMSARSSLTSGTC